jgi:hypothetical protein
MLQSAETYDVGVVLLCQSKRANLSPSENGGGVEVGIGVGVVVKFADQPINRAIVPTIRSTPYQDLISYQK